MENKPSVSVRAFIENIIYYNEDNHYAVLDAYVDSAELTIVGYFPYISSGETIEAEGSYITHPVYGKQFSAASFKVVPPEGSEAIERYLAGGAIKGIGAALAKRIVKKFKGDTFRIIEEEPERLAEIKGISLNMAMQISEQAEEKKSMREVIMFMQQYGIGTVLAGRIFEKYGPQMYDVIKENPYRLAEDIDGISFNTADKIALKQGMAPDDRFRIRCGLLYVLAKAAGEGHTYLPESRLLSLGMELLGIELGDIEPTLIELQIAGRIVIHENVIHKNAEHADIARGNVNINASLETAINDNALLKSGNHEIESCETMGERQVYLAAYYHTERNISAMLRSLAIKGEQNLRTTRQRISKVEKEIGLTLDVMQKKAVELSNENGVLIITGGPGTGKTAAIKALISFYAEDNEEVVLAAPTGRAAKRMTEATGCEAKTIHRLLEYTGAPTAGNAPGKPGSYEGTDGGLGAAPYAGGGNAGGAGSTDGKGRFLRDEKDPLEADVVIIDEMSMVDIFLMNALLKAIVPGTRLILVGDANQLPSVGAGNVLKDLLGSGCFETVRFDRIFRQAAMSDIVVNAHKINAGEKVDLSKKSRDFLFIKNSAPSAVTDSIKKLITEKLPGYVGCKPMDIQVLTATKKGALGVEFLNNELRDYLNPKVPGKKETKCGELTLRLGDKVMQVRNDYDLEWVSYDADGAVLERGSGVFNGDIGIISDIDELSETVTVVYDGSRYVQYDHKQLLNLELAYAVTVHKSQGSEYPAVIMPMLRGPQILMNRNLLYTAVTRAKSCVVMVGSPQVFEAMEYNESENKRYSGLKDRILELAGVL